MFFRSAAAFGWLFGVTFVLLDKLASPIVWALFWSALAVQMAVTAWVTWRRTGLRWHTMSAVHAATIEAAMVPVHLGGYTIATLPSAWMVMFGINVALAIAMNVGSEYEDRDKWARWKASVTRASLTDLLTFRHIPVLRDS
jgi:hypothetical protein